MKKEIAYAEVYKILSYMDKATVMKIPLEILTMFKEKRDKQYIVRVNPENLSDKNNVSKMAISIMAWLDLEFLSSPNEKEFLIKKYKRNERISEQKKKEIYNKLFDNTVKEQNTNLIVQQENIIANSIFKKIINRIKNFFNRFKNKL